MTTRNLISHPSGIYGSPVDLTTIGRPILSASNSTTSLNTFQSFKPLSLSIPRIRILLAPYMSPFVVPVHKVETWELLHTTLRSLFGRELFASGNPLRITDHQGNSILPSVWEDLLEPNMTIIVDTCSFQAENSPVIFETPPLPASQSPMNSPRDKGKRVVPWGVPDWSALERESEDSCYDAAHIMYPCGVLGQALPMVPIMPPPPRRAAISAAKSKAMEAWEGWAMDGNGEKRYTSLSMFAGKGSQRPHTSTGLEKDKDVEREVGSDVYVTEHRSSEIPKSEKKVKEKRSGKFARMARAVLFVLSGTFTSSPSASKPKRRSSVAKKTPPPSRTVRMEAIENNSAKLKQSSLRRSVSEHHRQRPSISKRRGLQTPPPVIPTKCLLTATNTTATGMTTATTTASGISVEDFPPTPTKNSLPVRRKSEFDARRSKSISYHPPSIKFEPAQDFHSKDKPITPAAEMHPIAPAPTSSIPQTIRESRRRSKSLSANKQTSPPIPPRRPSLELGVNAQYKTLKMDKTELLQELVKELHVDSDRSTLASSRRSRSGTGDTSGTGETSLTVDSAAVTPNKPLPKLPYKFSAFPPPSPPRTPIVLTPWPPRKPTENPEEWGKPATATAKKITRITLRKVASGGLGDSKGSNSTSVKKKKSFTGCAKKDDNMVGGMI
ncbi:hypothetical protein RUND412_002328 [Rhizina undulata]